MREIQTYLVPIRSYTLLDLLQADADTRVTRPGASL